MLDGALDSLRLMLSAEEGARSLLEAEGAIDRLVALIGRPGGGQKQTASALQIMARLVLISDKPLVESALARANRFRGARVGTTLVDLLKDERGELQTCVDAMTLINALVATTPDKRALVSELVSGGLDIALARLEERVGATPQLVAMGGGGTGQLSKQVSAFMQLKREMEASGRDSASAPAPAPSPTKKPSMLERAGSFFSGKEAAPAAAPPPDAAAARAASDDAAVARAAGNRQHARWRPAPPPPAPPPAPPPPPPPPPPGAPAAPKGPQLRMVHWTKVAATKLGQSVWEDADLLAGAGRMHDDLEAELRTLFEVKAAPKPSGGAASAAPRKSSVSGAAGAAAAGGGKVQLLDLKRSNQVNIALARFRSVAGPSEVAAAVARMDEKVITADDISRLQACAPTAEEIELLRRYIDGTDAAEGLESAERFLVEMGRVPSLPKLLSSWATKLSFEGRRADASEQLGGLERAAACARASPTLRTLLGIILSFGNVLNAASARGGARGFRSDVLLKLGETKTTAGASDKCPSGRVSNRDTAHEPTAHPAPSRCRYPEQTSLLHVVARHAAAREPDVHKALKAELQPLELSSALTIEGISTEVAALRREIDAAAAELPNHGAGAPFATMMGPFLAGAGAAQEALVARPREPQGVVRRARRLPGRDVRRGGARGDARPHPLVRRIVPQGVPRQRARRAPAEEEGGGGGAPQRNGEGRRRCRRRRPPPLDPDAARPAAGAEPLHAPDRRVAQARRGGADGAPPRQHQGRAQLDPQGRRRRAPPERDGAVRQCGRHF